MTAQMLTADEITHAALSISAPQWRFDALLLHIQSVREALNDPQADALRALMDDFTAMAQGLYKKACALTSEEASLHQVVDKLHEEWSHLFVLISTSSLGGAYFWTLTPLVELAKRDLRLEEQFVLLTRFGKKFSLFMPAYTTKPMYFLEMPLSVINAPWEWTVIWHELAGIKVRTLEIEKFLQTKYVNHPGLPPDGDPVLGLLRQIQENSEMDISSDARKKVQEYLSRAQSKDIVSWFTQLFEDACSVFALGEPFIPLLQEVLQRSTSSAKSDRYYPPVEFRIEVATHLAKFAVGSQMPSPCGSLSESSSAQDYANCLWEFRQQTDLVKLPALQAPNIEQGQMLLRQALINLLNVCFTSSQPSASRDAVAALHQAMRNNPLPLPVLVAPTPGLDEAQILAKLGLQNAANVAELLQARLSTSDNAGSAGEHTHKGGANFGVWMIIQWHQQDHSFFHGWGHPW